MSLFAASADVLRHFRWPVPQRSPRRVSRGAGGGRDGRRRRLRGERLETRHLLAAVVEGLQHNLFDPEDVDDDGQVTPYDLLLIINALNRQAVDDGWMFSDVNNDGFRTPYDALRVVNRLHRIHRGQSPIDHVPTRPASLTNIPETPSEIRSIDGTGNHREHIEWGSPNQPLLRVAAAEYADGMSSPAGQQRPSPRRISNLLADADVAGTRNDRSLSAYLYMWGQFLDHDIDLTLMQTDGESFAIEVPRGDTYFDPAGSGQRTIALERSQYASDTGTSLDNPRQQASVITAFVDGSQVYGSDQVTADSLRAFQGGRMRLTDAGLLPSDTSGEVMAGDTRAAENILLTSLQTLFVREHNRLADQLASAHPELSDEAIYQRARAVVIAELQAISYNEFLPALLGPRALASYRGYDDTVNPTVANEFSTAAFRFGHSGLNETIEFIANDGRQAADAIALSDAFFSASMLEETGIDAILKHGASTQSQEIDMEVVDSLRNFLFGVPGAGGFDLVSLNIQRGRDHGLADYNATRKAYGLEAVASFAEITWDVERQAELESVYGDVNRIDLWVGLLAEDHVHGASLGELGWTIIVDQFERLRDGDRLWYENVFRGAELRQLQSTSLCDVIERNTEVEGLQHNVFYMWAEVRGRVVGTPRASAAAGVTVELLDHTGQVIDSTLTNASGHYRFRSFAQTGDYQLRLANSSHTLDLLISTGGTRLQGLDLEIASPANSALFF